MTARSETARLGAKLREWDNSRSRITFPSPRFKGCILEFARDVLGVRSLASHQVEILTEYQDNDLATILVCTGQKLGKTECEIIAAAYDFGTERMVNVWLFAPKVDHTDAVFWPRFARSVIAAYYPCRACRPAHEKWCALVEADPFDETPRPERCPKCSPLIPSEIDAKKPDRGRVSEWLNPTDSESGLRAPDGRSVRAYTGRKEGAKGGFSGKVRFLADECSDIPDVDRETWAGNLSGGGKLMGFGNLLHQHGWFAEAFREKSKERSRWAKLVQKSSRLSPNCPGRIEWSDGQVTVNNTTDRPILHMATRQSIEVNIRGWGKDSPLVTARIDATPPKIVEGQLASEDRVRAAEQRWRADDEPTGILQFGVDVARMRDRFSVCGRRGIKMVELYAEALKQDDHALGVALLIDFGKKHRKPHERKPRLVYDATGLEGANFGKELHAQRAEDHFEIYAIQMAHPPRNRVQYDKRRDEIAHQFAEKLKHIAILPDLELEGEIAATIGTRVEVAYGGSGRKWEVLRVIDNEEIRKRLGRSPDKRNSAELAFLDIDGSETADMPPQVEDTNEQPTIARPIPRHAAPEDDIQDVGSIYDRQAQVYQALWGRT